MLRSLKNLEKYKVDATDGEIGSVVRFLLDDESWTLRYLVVETYGALFETGRQVLISPISFRQAGWPTQSFHLGMTMEMVKNSPKIDFAKPVSRQHERDLHRYYGYPYYWGSSGIWGMGPHPSLLASAVGAPPPDESVESTPDDVHLRSDVELCGYHIQGSDEAIGHVEDFIVDDETWAVRYLVIDTSNWWFGKKVLVSPQFASRISWAERKVFIDMSRQAIKDSPEWDARAALEREHESHQPTSHPVYWGVSEREPGSGQQRDSATQTQPGAYHQRN